MNTRHILVPSDMSAASLRPIERAPELFEGKKVTFLNVVSNLPLYAPSAPFAPAVDDPSLPQRLEAAKESLEKARETVPQASEVEIVVIPGNDHGRTVSEWADENDVDLIALSTHGRTGIRRFFLGSVAERVLRYSQVPVLTFPSSADEAD